MTSNTERLNILMKPRLTVRDIARLLGVGNSKATEMAKDFRRWFTEKYPDSPWFGIPTDLFVKRYKIDENHIIKFAEIEKKSASWPTA